MCQQCVGRSIQLRNRDNITTGVSKIYEREVQGRLPAANCERSDTALKFGDALFKNSSCRVSDPTVTITLNLQIEQCSTVIGAVESIRCGLVYWNSYSLGGWIGFISAMN